MNILLIKISIKYGKSIKLKYYFINGDFNFIVQYDVVFLFIIYFLWFDA